MPVSAQFFPLLASLRAALDQPIFPGKIVVWLLFMLSIVSWVLILSKLQQLRKTQRADSHFTERLRRSRTALEAFEQDDPADEASPKHLLYQAGARETAYWLLGSRDPGRESRVREGIKLPERQVAHIRAAFESGFLRASSRVEAGLDGLQPLALSALCLGLFGFVWTLMLSFDEAEDFAELAPKVGGALGHLALTLLVTGPALVARLLLHNTVRKRLDGLRRFREDMIRLFERSYAATGSEYTRPSGGRSEGEATPSGSEEKRRYHSIRDRLLRLEAEDAESEEGPINPIARQAGASQKRSRPE